MGLFNIFGSKTVKTDEEPKVEVPVVNKEYKLDPTLELERQLGEQIYNALQGNVVEEVLRQIKTSSSSDAYWRSNMEGHSLKVEKE